MAEPTDTLKPTAAPVEPPRPPQPTRRDELAQVIGRRPQVDWWFALVLGLAFSLVLMLTITADRWIAALGPTTVVAGSNAPVTVRVPPLAGYDTPDRRLDRGGIVIARGKPTSPADVENARAVWSATPRGPLPYVAFLLVTFALGGLFSYHLRRSPRGRLARVQAVNVIAVVALAVAVKAMLLATAISVLAVPVAVFALVPALVLDRIVGVATGVLAALVVALVGPFDVGIAVVLVVQAAAAGLIVAVQPTQRWKAVATAGLATTACTVAAYAVITYLTKGSFPAIADLAESGWTAALIGPLAATVLALPLIPLYQLAVGEITRGRLGAHEELSHPLLRQIAEKAPGTWQHSLMMANMGEVAANAIGADGRLVRVGAYFHDLGKSLQPTYFVENLAPGETSPHDQLPPDVSCNAIFAHVTEGIMLARRSGVHERIVDFMHMHHGDGVLEHFWAKAKEQGNPKGLTIDAFRYPGVPPQTRETAILTICDAVEAASRALRKPTPTAIDALVERIVYGKFQLGQLDESGLSSTDLRRINDSLRETLRHANHGRIEYPWQKAQQDASATSLVPESLATGPRLDSLDRPARPATAASSKPAARTSEDLATVATAPALVPPERSARQATRKPASPTPSVHDAETPIRPLDPVNVSTPAAVEPPVEARTKAATLPPTPTHRAPTVPPPGTVRKPPSTPPSTVPLLTRTAGPPTPVSLDNAVTNPPMSRARPPGSRPPAMIVEEDEQRPTLRRPAVAPHDAPIGDDDVTRQTFAAPESDAGDPDADQVAATAPAMSKLPRPTLTPEPGTRTPKVPGWAKGLAAKADSLDGGDEWGHETPVVAPTKAELRMLLGTPDPTREQSIDEVEALHLVAAADAASAYDANARLLGRTSRTNTSEVDPEDIEAAIEIAPPARKPGSHPIAVAKTPPKKRGE